MPRSEANNIRCLLCRGPLGAGHGRWCRECHLGLASHSEMMKLLQPHAEAAPLRAADPDRLARIARYEHRAARRLPLFPREEVPPWTRR